MARRVETEYSFKLVLSQVAHVADFKSRWLSNLFSQNVVVTSLNYELTWIPISGSNTTVLSAVIKRLFPLLRAFSVPLFDCPERRSHLRVNDTP